MVAPSNVISCCCPIHKFEMSRAVGASISLLLVLSQFAASCLGQYANGMATAVAGGLVDDGFGSRLGYSGAMGPVTPSSMGLGAECVQGPGYVGGFGQRLSTGGSNGLGTVYGGQGMGHDDGYDRVLGHPNLGVPNVLPNGPGMGYGPPGHGLGYAVASGIYNSPNFAAYGDVMPAYPFPTSYPNDASAIGSAQPSTFLTTNDNSNTNTNININNEMGKQRGGLLKKGIFGIGRL